MHVAASIVKVAGSGTEVANTVPDAVSYDASGSAEYKLNIAVSDASVVACPVPLIADAPTLSLPVSVTKYSWP